MATADTTSPPRAKVGRITRDGLFPGQRFGRLTVLFTYVRNKKTRLHVLCDCGRTKDMVASPIVRGRTQSCGCIRAEMLAERNRTHGMTSSPTYNLWQNMKRRCDDPKDKNYKYYGARGVTVCNRWKDFGNFIADMGEKPHGMSIDRIRPDGNYEPGNCRWADDATQAINRRRVRLVEIGGKVMTMTDAARALRVRFPTAVAMAERGELTVVKSRSSA